MVQAFSGEEDVRNATAFELLERLSNPNYTGLGYAKVVRGAKSQIWFGKKLRQKQTR